MKLIDLPLTTTEVLGKNPTQKLFLMKYLGYELPHANEYFNPSRELKNSLLGLTKKQKMLFEKKLQKLSRIMDS